MYRLFAYIISAFLVISTGFATAAEVNVAVIRVDYPQLLPITRYDIKAEDSGFAGATLGDEDNSTTGAFMGHKYSTQTAAVAPDALEAKVQEIQAQGIGLFVILARAEDVLRVADMAQDALVLNATAPDLALRDDQCRANLLHIAPSNSMLSDAIGQFAIWKKWDQWFLVSGSNPADQAIANAYRRTAEKFGATIVEEREFEDTGGTRRTDTGHTLVQKQLPVFMQDAEDHDIVIAADGTDYFARYLPFHLWTPRPVMGSAGLQPVTFHGAHEAWGATQFQTRFEKLTGRYVKPDDYNAWLALRVIGEAVTRTNKADPTSIREYVLSDQFELAAFKGQKVTFRDWNGQLRQPILLYDGQITVSVSPQDGFLHQFSPLDTLGLDRPESKCTAFAK